MPSAASGSAEPGGASPDALPYDRVVLVGFMASGKSTVGRQLARRLKWRFVDLDRAVEAQAGKSIPEIFRTEGEAAFRELEEEVGRELLSHQRVVLSTGGGWGGTPGRVDSLDSRTLSVWLQVDLRRALGRARRSPGTRPLLSGPNPLETARQLLEAREPHYRRAALILDADGKSARVLARTIVEHILGAS
ncbi:MAG: shikimate kinase [Gemmatimonadota bacterium]